MGNSSDIAGSIPCLKYGEAGFKSALESLLSRDKTQDLDLQSQVSAILEEIRSQGDAALIELTNRLDRRAVQQISELCIGAEEMTLATSSVEKQTVQALQQAADRIRKFHEKQVQSSWSFEDEWGNQLGQRIQAIQRVGIYVPGGQAAYPSSMLMNAIPARVAGVTEIIATVPAPNNLLNPMVLAA
ncbi:MAG TPA: histidinol dehydrogenase, partial [Gammaproteobacteria bacterium]|nr:histidinol dehydrogenase [Gammaproteobacteria bacterium]